MGKATVMTGRTRQAPSRLRKLGMTSNRRAIPIPNKLLRIFIFKRLFNL